MFSDAINWTNLILRQKQQNSFAKKKNRHTPKPNESHASTHTTHIQFEEEAKKQQNGIVKLRVNSNRRRIKGIRIHTVYTIIIGVYV